MPGALPSSPSVPWLASRHRLLHLPSLHYPVLPGQRPDQTRAREDTSALTVAYIIVTFFEYFKLLILILLQNNIVVSLFL